MIKQEITKNSITCLKISTTVRVYYVHYVLVEAWYKV